VCLQTDVLYSARDARARALACVAGEEDMEKMRLPPVSVGGRQMSLESQCGIGAIFGICLQAATDVVCDASRVEALSALSARRD
jgi:hypothetical protein